MSVWWHADGAIDALPLDDRSWQYGDGLFETVALRSGTPRLLDWHLERLAIGCRRLSLPGIDAGALHSVIERALDAADGLADFGVLKLVVTAGSGPRGYRRAAPVRCRVLAATFPGQPLDRSCYVAGVRVAVCNTRLARQPMLAGIKTLNRLEQVLARQELASSSVFEGLTFDTAGELICGTMSNVFLVDGAGRISTPDLSHAGVNGVMRRKVLEVLASMRIDATITAVDAARLHGAAELLICNSQFGVLPVARLGDRVVGAGPVTASLMQALAADGFPEIAI